MKRIISILLAVISVLTVVSTVAFAANTTSDYKQFDPPSGSDYAFWNGKRMVRHSGTTIDNVRWMQAMFNWFTENGYPGSGAYLSISKLVVDGSFGPACKNACLRFQRKAGLQDDGSCGPKTIAKMKAIRDDILQKQKSGGSSGGSSKTACDFIWPIAGGAGSVSHKPGDRSYEKHVGTDIGTQSKTPAILAVADGTVLAVNRTAAKERGFYVTIRHGAYICVYQHMKQAASVKVGQTVSQGQVIGYVGSTGRSYGEHLHFEMVLESSLSKKSSLTECLWSDVNLRNLKPVYYWVSRGEKVGSYYKLDLHRV